MGRYSANGMTTHYVSQGHDPRAHRDKNSEGWPHLTIHTAEAIAAAMKAMGFPAHLRTHRGPLILWIEPAAVNTFTLGWDTERQTGDERFLEVMARRPVPVRLKRGTNQVLLINRRS